MSQLYCWRVLGGGGLAAPGAPFNCQLPHGDLENFLLVFKNGQSTRKREANPTHHAASLSALGSSLGQRNGGVPTWVDLAGIDPRDQTQGI